MLGPLILLGMLVKIMAFRFFTYLSRRIWGRSEARSFAVTMAAVIAAVTLCGRSNHQTVSSVTSLFYWLGWASSEICTSSDFATFAFVVSNNWPNLCSQSRRGWDCSRTVLTR